MKDLVDYINRRIARAEKIIATIKEEQGDIPEKTHTYHGGWTLGYWEGKLTTLDDVLYEIEKMQETE